MYNNALDHFVWPSISGVERWLFQLSHQEDKIKVMSYSSPQTSMQIWSLCHYWVFSGSQSYLQGPTTLEVLSIYCILYRKEKKKIIAFHRAMCEKYVFESVCHIFVAVISISIQDTFTLPIHSSLFDQAVNEIQSSLWQMFNYVLLLVMYEYIFKYLNTILYFNNAVSVMRPYLFFPLPALMDGYTCVTDYWSTIACVLNITGEPAVVTKTHYWLEFDWLESKRGNKG